MSAGGAWERVVRAALLGTERQSEVDAATGDAALDRSVAALADRPAEARLLGTSALLDAWRRAGHRAPRITVPPPEPAPEAEERACSPLADRVLRQLLAGEPTAVLVEWMTLAGRVGVAIPPEMLPAVLDFARRHAEVRDAVHGALGPRGRWLASRNPAWSPAAANDGAPAEAWQTATSAERLDLLTRVRRADPAAGLALLQSTWATDAPADRAGFLGRLEAGLSMADEPFLESALDDRRKEVRLAAVALLAQIPDSRLMRRMIDRAEPLLTLHVPDGFLSRLRGASAKIEVRLPEACDKGMIRDGIEPKPGHGFGERGWWLHQVLAVIPPATWAARWGRTPDELLAAARAGEDGDLLVRAWRAATFLARDAAWAEALLGRMSGRDSSIQPAAALLPRDRLEARILAALSGGRIPPHADRVAPLLLAARFPWSAAATRAVLSALPAEVTPSDWGLRELLRGTAPYMDPTTAVAVLRERGDRHEGPWVDLLHLRSTLHQAFA